MTDATPEFDRERYEDLRVDHALYGLMPQEMEDLENLSRRAGIPLDDDSFELAVAALDAAWSGHKDSEELPLALRQNILAEAGRFVDGQSNNPVPDSNPSPPPTGPAPPAPTSAWTARERWLAIALAASLLVGLASLTGWIASSPGPAPAGTTVASMAQQRRELMESAPDATLTVWKTTPDPAAAGVIGDIVWSDQRQAGFMRFEGLPVNDPTLEQYQLWIFDTRRDEAMPVDGGVFDIAGTGEVIVPVDAKLDISEAWQFAVTIEKPGGVVQSDRSRLPLLATVER